MTKPFQTTMYYVSCLFFQQGQSQFEEKWPSMRPSVLKLLRQEPVTRSEWHDLFWYS